jgi:quercetin dioxygenase-like cupin family protein
MVPAHDGTMGRMLSAAEMERAGCVFDRRRAASGKGEIMADAIEFPELVTGMPEADLPLEDVETYLLQGDAQQAVFFRFNKTVPVLEHAHAAQWIIVLAGEIALTIEGETTILKKGDTKYIPEGARHSAIVKKGYTSMELFDQKDRFAVKARRSE